MSVDDLLKAVLAQAPTVAVLLYVFYQIRLDVKEIMSNLLRMLENCIEDADNDGIKGNKGPD